MYSPTWSNPSAVSLVQFSTVSLAVTGGNWKVPVIVSIVRKLSVARGYTLPVALAALASWPHVPVVGNSGYTVATNDPNWERKVHFEWVRQGFVTTKVLQGPAIQSWALVTTL